MTRYCVLAICLLLLATTGGSAQIIGGGGGGVSGSGATNTVPVWTSSTGLGNSLLVSGATANRLEQYNGTSSQTLYIFNTRTDGSNYEAGIVGWLDALGLGSNQFLIGGSSIGTGSIRHVLLTSQSRAIINAGGGWATQIMEGGTLRFEVDPGGILFAGVDNTQDIGVLIGTGETRRFRDDYVGTDFVAGRGFQTGATYNTKLTLNAGEIGQNKMTAAASAPGAGGGKFAIVCGTGAGTAKLVIRAGTSSTAVTIADNIGAGVTGC